MVKLLGKLRSIDSRNRVTLPPEVLKLLGLKPNDEVFYVQSRLCTIIRANMCFAQ